MFRGITVGKFWPFHLGHDLMIRSGLKALGSLKVLVANDSPEKNRLVIAQMKERYREEIRNGSLSLQQFVDNEKTKTDSSGVSTDPDYLQRWANRLVDACPGVEFFVSSDLYGKVISELMGVKWFPVDPDRSVFDVSATRIREDPGRYWDFVTPEAKLDWAQVVAVVGAESTGKSTMVKSLASDATGLVGVQEYGRTLAENRSELTLEDFESIIEVQYQMIQSAKLIAPVVLTDTEALVSHLYSEVYLNKGRSKILNLFKEGNVRRQRVDHYLVTGNDVPWVNDGSRVMPSKKDRDEFRRRLLEDLNFYNLSYFYCGGKNFGAMRVRAARFVYPLLHELRSPV